MKTIFKVGMKVYDQVCFPNKEGVIVGIDEEWAKLNYPCLKVKFKDETQEFSYTNEGCLCDNYYWIPTLSTSPYTLQGFEQKSPAPTFEEAWEEAERVYEPKSEYDEEEYKGYPSQELADASEALRRLLFLRDYYNEGWQPDWKDKKQRGVSVTLDCDNNFMVWGILKETEPYKFIFKNDETAEKFLEEQKELLEIAKPLL